MGGPARMSAAAFRKMVADEKAKQAKQKKGPGGGNRRVANAQRTTSARGEKMDSRRELRAYEHLRIRQEIGEIRDLRRQVKVPLWGRDGPIMTDSGKRQRVWVADFTYVEVATGTKVYADAKGHPTEVYLLKRSILAAMGIHVLEL